MRFQRCVVVVYDDSELECCAETLVIKCDEVTLAAGIEDNFSPTGIEPNNTPPEWYTPGQTMPFVGFDFQGGNRWFGHRFILPQSCQIAGAILIIRVKPLWGDATNDGVILRIGADKWMAQFGPPAGVYLQSSSWTPANFPDGHTFTLDLANLPGGGNLLAPLNAQRLLDVIVQDDTSVDFVKLIVKLCCP